MIEYYKKHSIAEKFHQASHAGDDTWVHLGAPTASEIEQVVEAYGLDAAIVNDVLDKNELSRSEFSKGVQYVFMRPAMRTRAGEIKTRPFLAILHPKVFVTIATSMAVTTEAIAIVGDRSKITTAKRAGMLIATVNAIVSEYEKLLQHTDEYIGSIRKKLRMHEVGNKDFVHFVTIEDNLNEYQTCLRDTLTVVDRLRENSHGLFTAHEVELIEDTRLYIKQLLSAVESLMHTINSIRNAYSTIANNTLNQRMKILTALTVLIALPNVFYGMYGMNVPLPFQHEGWVYPIIVLFTFSVILLVYIIAKRYKVF